MFDTSAGPDFVAESISARDGRTMVSTPLGSCTFTQGGTNQIHYARTGPVCTPQTQSDKENGSSSIYWEQQYSNNRSGNISKDGGGTVVWLPVTYGATPVSKHKLTADPSPHNYAITIIQTGNLDVWTPEPTRKYVLLQIKIFQYPLE